jgi:hypothetical protein
MDRTLPGMPFTFNGGFSMNFPTQPLFEFFYWLVNTPGLGGIVLAFLTAGVIVAAIFTLRWICAGKQVKPSDAYSYPAESLFHGD